MCYKCYKYYNTYNTYNSYNTYFILSHAPPHKKNRPPLRIVCFLFIITKEYNTDYFEDCRKGIKRSILCVCEHLAPEQDTKRVVLDTFD